MVYREQEYENYLAYVDFPWMNLDEVILDDLSMLKGEIKMKTKRFLILLIASLLLSSLLLSACASQGNTLDGTNWQMTGYQDPNGNMANILPGTVVTAQFQSANISGIAGCNNYNGTYAQNGKNLSFGPLATTRKACADPLGVMDQESAYLADLAQVQSYKQSNTKLEMQDNKGKTILEFAPAGQ